jgi:hypothetical protein
MGKFHARLGARRDAGYMKASATRKKGETARAEIFSYM